MHGKKLGCLGMIISLTAFGIEAKSERVGKDSEQDGMDGKQGCLRVAKSAQCTCNPHRSGTMEATSLKRMRK